MSGVGPNNHTPGMSPSEMMESGVVNHGEVAPSVGPTPLRYDELREAMERGTASMFEASRLGVYLALGLIASFGVLSGAANSAEMLCISIPLLLSIGFSLVCHLRYGFCIKSQVNKYLNDPKSLSSEAVFFKSLLYLGVLQGLGLLVGTVMFLSNI